MSANQAIEGLYAEGVTVQRDGRTLVDRVDVAVRPGELVAMVGPNGAGKTSLVRALVGRDRPTAGQVRVGADRLAHLTARQRAAHIAWLPQIRAVTEPVPVVDAVAAARFRFDETHHTSRQQALRALGEVGASALADRRLDQLSGGERQRIALAELVAQEAEYWVLDEPGNHLDPRHQAALYRQIGEIAVASRAVFVVTHDVNLLFAAATAGASVRVVGLDEGRLRFDRALDDPELAAELGRLFRMQVHVVEVGGQQRFVWVAEPATEAP